MRPEAVEPEMVVGRIHATQFLSRVDCVNETASEETV